MYNEASEMFLRIGIIHMSDAKPIVFVVDDDVSVRESLELSIRYDSASSSVARDSRRGRSSRVEGSGTRTLSADIHTVGSPRLTSSGGGWYNPGCYRRVAHRRRSCLLRANRAGVPAMNLESLVAARSAARSVVFFHQSPETAW